MNRQDRILSLTATFGGKIKLIWLCAETSWNLLRHDILELQEKMKTCNFGEVVKQFQKPSPSGGFPSFTVEITKSSRFKKQRVNENKYQMAICASSSLKSKMSAYFRLAQRGFRNIIKSSIMCMKKILCKSPVQIWNII